VLLATDIPTADEREAAVAVAPWQDRAAFLTGTIRGAFDHNAIGLIDLAIGEDNHARAALVALYEGADTLLQGTWELAESVVAELVFDRLGALNPHGTGEPLTAEGQRRFPRRMARVRLENAAVAVATAGDHLANAHLRLAHEANAATADELCGCGFDAANPSGAPSAPQLRKGLAKADPSGVLSAFELNEPFLTYIAVDEVREARDYRDAVIHRERPGHREAPSLGRASVWAGPAIDVSFPRSPAEAAALLPLADRRKIVATAAEATLLYAEAAWDLAVRWLATIEVTVIRYPGGVKLSTNHYGSAKYPRESRDPGPFLRIAR